LALVTTPLQSPARVSPLLSLTAPSNREPRKDVQEDPQTSLIYKHIRPSFQILDSCTWREVQAQISAKARTKQETRDESVSVQESENALVTRDLRRRASDRAAGAQQAARPTATRHRFGMPRLSLTW